jgi:hypothetical protein
MRLRSERFPDLDVDGAPNDPEAIRMMPALVGRVGWQ